MKQTESNYQFPGAQILEIVQGDITREKVDAIVNAANSQLMHGGGVAADISRRGGEVIQQESDSWVRDHGKVTHSQPAFTRAGNLPCKVVIHAVGPVWGDGDEEKKLAAAIQGSLRLAEKLKITSIAFPAISTGIFGFPKELAAEIFMRIFRAYFTQNPHSCIKTIRMIILDLPTYKIFLQAFQKEFSSK